MKRRCYYCGNQEKADCLVILKNAEVRDSCLGCAKYMNLQYGCNVIRSQMSYVDDSYAYQKPTYPVVKVRGGEKEKMKIEKGVTGANNIKVDFVLSKRISRLTIIDEGEIMRYEGKDGKPPTEKLMVGVKYDGQSSGDPEKWVLNNKSRNVLIDIFGDDTKTWVNKDIEIAISGDGEYQHIVVDTLRTKNN